MTTLFWTIMMLYLYFYVKSKVPNIVAWREARKFRKELNQDDFPVEHLRSNDE